MKTTLMTNFSSNTTGLNWCLCKLLKIEDLIIFMVQSSVKCIIFWNNIIEFNKLHMVSKCIRHINNIQQRIATKLDKCPLSKLKKGYPKL